MYYWKQKLSKQYYVFCIPEVVDQADLHIDEDNIKEQIESLKLDIHFIRKEESEAEDPEDDLNDESETLSNDNDYNDTLIQLDVMFLQIIYPTAFEIFKAHFEEVLSEYYCTISDSIDNDCPQTPKKKGCSQVIL